MLYALLGIVVVVALFVAFVASRPSQFHIERSLTMAASPESAFNQVNDFHAWSAWSPWERIDPNMQRTYEGPESGVGASYAWKGNNKVGEGRMLIQKSLKPSLIEIQLQFIKPWTATNTAAFAFIPVSEGTKVTWSMRGSHAFMAKAFMLFMDMDRMVGGDFEKGLAAMKTAAEADAAKARA